MPILLHVDELKPGLCLAQTVYHGDQRLLSGGQKLESWQIDSLRRRFPDLQVRVMDPILDSMGEFEDDTQNKEVSATVTSLIGRMMSKVQAKLGARTALDGSDLAGLRGTITEVIHYLEAHPVTAAVLSHTKGRGDYLQEHAANVMYLSLLVGNAVRDYIYHERARATRGRNLSVRYGINLTPLALGCLFHDLGMIGLEDMMGQEGPLSPADEKRLRRHPLTGTEMLPEEIDAISRMIVRTHHENMNGTGYPQGLPGDKLHVFSRIIRVADAFDAATSDRVYKQAKPVARVLWEITLGPTRHFYDPLIARILNGLVQPFPIGAKIRLNCGRWVVVVRHNRKHPFRPTVLIAFDEEGRRLKRKQLSHPFSLAEAEDVRLVEFGGHDLSFLNSGPEMPPASGPGLLDAPGSSGTPLVPHEAHDLFSLVYP